MRVHVADHPLITHKLTVLRDERTPSPTFRSLVEELMTLLAYEATRNVRVTPKEEGVEISTSGAAASLAGVNETTSGIETTYQIQVLFAVPPADAPEGTQIQVVGYSQALLDANEVGQ